MPPEMRDVMDDDESDRPHNGAVMRRVTSESEISVTEPSSSSSKNRNEYRVRKSSLIG
jgi:hypothetical protein